MHFHALWRHKKQLGVLDFFFFLNLKHLSNDKSLKVYVAISQKYFSCAIFDK
jgi:hypothetical protein